MRRALAVSAVLASLLFSAFALAGSASADPGGNNGDVKIHDTGTAAEDQRNEPHVCNFYIDGFNFDGSSSGTWRIEGWAPTGSGVVASNSWGPADGKGNWRSSNITLPDGHYKLFVKQTQPMTPGGEKQKVFWVECAPAPATGNAPATSATIVGGTTVGGTTTGGAVVGNTIVGGTTVGGTTTGMLVGGTTTGTIVGGTTVGGTTTGGTMVGNTIVGGTTVGGTTTGMIVGGTATGMIVGGTTVGGTTTGGTMVGNTIVGGTTVGGTTVGTAVLGVQTPPSNALPGGSNQQSPNAGGGAVNGVQSLPSTSTAGGPTIPLAALGLVMMAIGAVLLRRRDIRM